MSKIQSGYDIDNLFQEAQTRWLKPAEVLSILQNHEKYQLTQEPAQQPTSGSLFLFNKRVLRFFRKDGHRWRKKKDGRTVGEAHERLKVGNAEALNCYYAHGEENHNFQRRSYWMLDPAYEHIVLVHYRDITEGKPNAESAAQLSPGSFLSFTQSPCSSTTPNQGSTSIGDVYEPCQSLTSPGSIEVSSDVLMKTNGGDYFQGVERTGNLGSSTELNVSQALRRLEEQLSLNDDSLKEFDPSGSQDEDPVKSELEYDGEIPNQEQYANFHGHGHIIRDRYYSGHTGMQDNGSLHQHQFYGHEYTDGRTESSSWNDVLDSCKALSGGESQKEQLYTLQKHESPLSSGNGPTVEQEHPGWLNSNGKNVENSSMLLPQEVNNFPYSSVLQSHETNSDYYMMLFGNQGRIELLESDVNLTIAQRQKFTIREICPDWGYATETTKIIIIGSFLCDSLESRWNCMFGDVEVPAQIIQEGVIRCEAPPHPSGKITLCITSGNRVSCSEVREFEYRVKNVGSAESDSTSTGSTKSAEELLLLVRFVQMLLSDSASQNGNNIGSETPRKLFADDDSWDSVIEALLVGSGTSSGTIYWLLEELLKDKLLQWISSRSQEQIEQAGCSLSKKEQGIIHMIAGLGFEWALNPVLSSGANINFRDINGWTALHWAARFGREKMVAALIASGAFAGAVTDPSSQDPTGKTPAAVAAISGHRGLAGYLSEVALTSHLSSLTLEESELSKGSAEVEAEKTVNSISKQNLTISEDQLSLKDTLAAVRNAAQAAARIQSAFRAHSFRKRLEKEAAASTLEEYGINSDDIKGLSMMSKMAFGNPRDYNSAALSIQKKYRGWKGRKDFLAFRQKVVKIQACVRGYQVRKHYKVICWAVGVLEKVVLRWRRKGVGLRGFRQDSDSIAESEDEDILKVFRKQKVDVAIDEAVSRVLSMVDSSEARQQYHRVLEKYRQAKQAKLSGMTDNAEPSTTNVADICTMEDLEAYDFLDDSFQ
ncbi:calmodulin-binding transcription activator 4 isoform X1 [Ziziphus jujuba]|uniref:Calmodulin-binding transcription activator 4 isoform X1 n=1 Tax=Ziziphus jujuba TaxID=326968 RepID=A0A6P4AYC0_ZIZJJ|nr:calmodulin-binding transcription activator 4 isoform X1 [Ziziphus jujuba]